LTPYVDLEGTIAPIHYWTPSIAPSGLAIYSGKLFKDWKGNYLVGALRERALYRVVFNEDGSVSQERYLEDLKARVRDVREGPDGAIYIALQSAKGGRVLRLSPAE